MKHTFTESHEQCREYEVAERRQPIRLNPPAVDRAAVDFCRRFVDDTELPRFVLGRNEYARSIISHVNITGVIDDFTHETNFSGLPVVKMQDIPSRSLVVSSLIGKPQLGARVLDEHHLAHLDYFAFAEYSGLPVKPVKIWNEFRQDFATNRPRYQWLFETLCDKESRKTFSDIIHFRNYGVLDYMSAYSDCKERQFEESFLPPATHGAVYVDAGGYDGDTCLDFIRYCPGYGAIHLFEPETDNVSAARSRLASHRDVHIHPIGLSDRKQALRFASSGTASSIRSDGGITIEVDKLDSIITGSVSVIKMDIEGYEGAALQGAKRTIARCHPAMAICVYHKPDDLWRIPQQVLSTWDGYEIYLRHYSEGVDETVMFFVPRQSSDGDRIAFTGGAS